MKYGSIYALFYYTLNRFMATWSNEQTFTNYEACSVFIPLNSQVLAKSEWGTSSAAMGFTKKSWHHFLEKSLMLK